MTKRTKRYAETTVEHRRDAADALRRWRKQSREAARVIAAGRCTDAIDILAKVRVSKTMYEAEKYHAGDRYFQRKPRPGYINAAYRAEGAVMRRTENNERAFRKKCGRWPFSDLP